MSLARRRGPRPGCATERQRVERRPAPRWNIFFDVQGTIIFGGVPRVREVFLVLIEMGHRIYLWSSAGSAYAAQAAKVLGVKDLVSGCFSKTAIPPLPVNFAVDDHPNMVDAFGGYRVSPFRETRTTASCVRC